MFFQKEFFVIITQKSFKNPVTAVNFARRRSDRHSESARSAA